MRKHPQSVFGIRLRAAREAAAIPQDRLGVMIGIDEGCSSARISRYESGTHQAPYEIAEKLAKVLRVPVAYLYCRSEALSELLLASSSLNDYEIGLLIKSAKRLQNRSSKK